ncbi:MAG: hypothetical protein ABIT16_04200 [Croceibacterium sp.]
MADPDIEALRALIEQARDLADAEDRHLCALRLTEALDALDG